MYQLVRRVRALIFGTIISVGTFVFLTPNPADADVVARQALNKGGNAYLFGAQPAEVDRFSCMSLSGESVLCDTQRSIVSDPVYVGFGYNVGHIRDVVQLAVEADYDAGLSSDHDLVPTIEGSRGLTIMGQLRFQ